LKIAHISDLHVCNRRAVYKSLVSQVIPKKLLQYEKYIIFFIFIAIIADTFYMGPALPIILSTLLYLPARRLIRHTFTKILKSTAKHSGLPTRSQTDALFSEIVHLISIYAHREYNNRNLAELVRSLNELHASGSLDLVIISGDVTGLAREEEFEEALAGLNSLEPPYVLCPGNHDRINVRGSADIGDYFEVPTTDVPLTHTHSTESSSIDVVSFDTTTVGESAASLFTTNVAGEFSSEALDSMDTFLSGSSATFKCLVSHHHPYQLTEGDIDPHCKIRETAFDDLMLRPAKNAERLLSLCKRENVDLLLFGHRHMSSVRLIPINPRSDARTVVCACGGATLLDVQNNRIRYRLFDLSTARTCWEWIEVELPERPKRAESLRDGTVQTWRAFTDSVASFTVREKRPPLG